MGAGMRVGVGAGEGGQLVGAQVFAPVGTAQVFGCAGGEVGLLVLVHWWTGGRPAPASQKRKIIFFVKSG